MRQAVVVDAIRSPIGRFQGALANVRPDDLAAAVVRDLVRRTTVQPEQIDDLLVGCANQAGEDARNVARIVGLLADLPHSVPAVTLNRLCGSGLEAVVQADRAIRCGDSDAVVAAGVESMSRAPYSMPRAPQHPKAGALTAYDTALGWRYPNPAVEERIPLESMGQTVENILARTPITREDQDAFALRSHQRAVNATTQGWFEREILPIQTSKGLVHIDEGPRPDTSLAKLARLRPAFRSDGTVTAGNSSTLNDGAAAALITDSAFAETHGLEVRARIRSTAIVGCDPRTMGLGPIPAVRRALSNASLSVRDIDVWEVNEAFAGQALAVCRSLEVPLDKVNLHGGAIALGHPLGCTGVRLLATALGVMDRTNARTAVVTLCIGVGQGMAVVLER